MKVFGINASPRGSKSQTLRLVNKVLEGARSAGAEVELVDVCKMLAADGLVMGSPNYF